MTLLNTIQEVLYQGRCRRRSPKGDCCHMPGRLLTEWYAINFFHKYVTLSLLNFCAKTVSRDVLAYGAGVSTSISEYPPGPCSIRLSSYMSYLICRNFFLRRNLFTETWQPEMCWYAMRMWYVTKWYFYMIHFEQNNFHAKQADILLLSLTYNTTYNCTVPLSISPGEDLRLWPDTWRVRGEWVPEAEFW